MTNDNGNFCRDDVSRAAAILMEAFGHDSCDEAVERARQQEQMSLVKPFATAVRKEVERICRERKAKS